MKQSKGKKQPVVKPLKGRRVWEIGAALFLLARSYGEGRSSGRALTALSGLSFGVYLVHPMAIQFWQKAWTVEICAR